MKTIRTIIATLSAVLLTFALLAWFSVRRNAAFLQRTIYQGFDQTFVVALVMGCAFLLIAVILTVAIVSIENDEEDEEDEEDLRSVRPRPRTQSGGSRPAVKGEQPYRRVARSQSTAPSKDAGEDAFARPKGKAAETSKPKKQRATESPEEMIIRGEEPKAKKKHPAPKTEDVIPPEPEQTDEPTTIQRPATEDPLPEEGTAPKPVEAPEAEKLPESEEAPAAEAEPVAAEPPEIEAAPAEEPEQGALVRCVFCGGSVERGIEVCPHCGKKM